MNKESNQSSQYPYMIEKSDKKLYLSERICCICRQYKKNFKSYGLSIAYVLGVLVGSSQSASAVHGFVPRYRNGRFCPHYRVNNRSIFYSQSTILHEKNAREPKENLRQHDVLVESCEGTEIWLEDAQLQKKFKHAKDFGVLDSCNRANINAYREKLIKHLKSEKTTLIDGKYRNQEVEHYLNPETGLNIIVKEGKFLSAWKLTPEQLTNVLEFGTL